MSDSQTPAKQYRTNRESRADRRQQDEVPFLDPFLTHCIVQRERNGCRGGVAVQLEIDHDLFVRKPEALGGGGDDSPVRLVRDEEIEIGSGEVVPLEHALANLFRLLDRELEHGRTILLD